MTAEIKVQYTDSVTVLLGCCFEALQTSDAHRTPQFSGSCQLFKIIFWDVTFPEHVIRVARVFRLSWRSEGAWLCTNGTAASSAYWRSYCVGGHISNFVCAWSPRKLKILTSYKYWGSKLASAQCGSLSSTKS